jgi:hypothetical protein
MSAVRRLAKEGEAGEWLGKKRQGLTVAAKVAVG